MRVTHEKGHGGRPERLPALSASAPAAMVCTGAVASAAGAAMFIGRGASGLMNSSMTTCPSGETSRWVWRRRLSCAASIEQAQPIVVVDVGMMWLRTATRGIRSNRIRKGGGGQLQIEASNE